jgi:6-phosphogluconolactonase (cycloisomerase 2 family)
MRLLGWLVPLAVAVVAGTSVSAAAAEGEGDNSGRAVFVQTNDPNANAIAAYHRNPDGSLQYRATYPTGGKGGRIVGAAVDPLASQGSLVFIRDEHLLLAVNAGSNTVSVFQVNGDRLHLNQVISSGGLVPVSIAVHEELVYVLDAGGGGSVSGYRLDDGSLHPIANSTRSLSLTSGIPPFLWSAAEVGFTPSGEQLIVTTKLNNIVDVFSVGDEGRLSAQPVQNAVATLPFAFLFDRAGRLVLNYAATSSLQTFTVNPSGTITPVSAPVSDGEAALCWATEAHGFVYGGNTGSGDVSQFRVNSNGSITLVNAKAATGIPGAIDMVAAGGSFLYVEGGRFGTVSAFAIGADGSLTLVQTVSVPGGASLEGIAVN